MAILASLLGLSAAAASAPLCKAPANLIANAGFEAGSWSPGARPDGWGFDSYTGTAVGAWDNTVSRSGQYSVRIDAPNPDDARWTQPAPVVPSSLVWLEGWIRSEDVQVADPMGSPGATISAYGRWERSPPTLGTTPWRKVGVSMFTDGSTLVAAPRLGFWSGLATGRAWYDDLLLVPRVPDTPHPRWKILLLVYERTDVTITSSDGTPRHVVGASTSNEIGTTIGEAQLFVERDIPALSSGNVMPTLAVRRIATPLDRLSPIADGWWPSPGDVARDVEPGFDSVIVIWDPRVQDVATGEWLWIGYGAGLSLGQGLGPTYVSMSIEYAGMNGHRNVYKHEWGHSILSYHDALQATPQPAVDNHATASQYVNCKTGQPYVWVDETTANPIPNSIYHNQSGFTHDYYSGTVARAEEPTRCLGIGPQAWAWGGPVSHPGSEPAFAAADRVRALAAQVDALELAQMLDAPSASSLRDELARAQRWLDASRERLAGAGLKIFARRVDRLVRGGLLLQHAASLLIEGATAAGGCIAP